MYVALLAGYLSDFPRWYGLFVFLSYYYQVRRILMQVGHKLQPQPGLLSMELQDSW